MLFGKLLKAKSLFTISTGEKIIDLVQSTFKFGASNVTMGPTFINEDEVMRPDKLSEKLYADQKYWDVILKFNGISNPFSLDFGEFLLAPSVNSLQSLVVPAKQVVEKGSEPAKKNEESIVKPKTAKDVKILESIRTKTSEVVPPNVNLSGSTNVKVVNGRVILGGDMTQNNSTTTNQTNVRARVQTQLQNNQIL